jgi:hypothetical protein
VDEYSQKYGKRARSSSKPDCYGDVDLYDSAHEICVDCPVKGACRIVVDRKIDQEVRETRVTRGRSKGGRARSRARNRRETAADVEPVANKHRAPVTQADSFWSALMFNSFLTATKSVLLEAHHGVDSIPYMRYPDPFRLED